MTFHFLNDISNDAESTQNRKLRHNGLFEECSTMSKLINRIPGSRLLISSKPRDVNKRSQSLAW